MTAAAPPSRCTVCRAPGVRDFMSIAGRAYWRCDTCLATVLDPSHWLMPTAELAHYRTHQNDPADPRYRAFLSRFAAPFLSRLAPASLILDYGCGPGPALAAMLAVAGHTTRLYDPYFHPDASALATHYDAIACTETAEHFHAPADEFDRLGALLRPGGLIGIMTSFQTDDDRFAAWHYRADPTHVVFYRAETLRHVASQRGWSFESPVKDIALMRRPLDG